jgi:hypothetical protein
MYAKQKLSRYILPTGAVMLVIGVYFVSQAHIARGYKYPDDYATAEEETAAIDSWTNSFYDSHPGSTLRQWADARHQFWIDHNCRAALQRYEQAKSMSGQ